MLARLLLLLPLVLGSASCETPRDRLERRIDRLLEPFDATVGIAIRLPDGAMLLRNDTPLPLLSLFKFPVALAAIERSIRDSIPLTTPLPVGPEWLDAGTYSPMRDSLPPQGGRVRLADLVAYAVTRSDNIACDLLIDFAGGIDSVGRYLQRHVPADFRIVATERTMHLALDNQRLNTASPSSVVGLFEALLRGELLPPPQTEWLCKLLEHTTTGPDKLRAGIPRHIRLGHKTGSSDRTPEGIRIADNDAGYLLLPDGRTLLLAVLVTDSREEDARNAALIAAIARCVWAYCSE